MSGCSRPKQGQGTYMLRLQYGDTQWPISSLIDCGGHQVALKETDINVSIVPCKHSWPLVYGALVGPS